MKLSTLLNIAGLIVIPLQATTFYYALSIERRLTRIETTLHIKAEPVRAPEQRS